MSNYPYVAPTLYDAKSNWKPLDPAIPATQGWTETEANQVRTLLNLLYIAATQGDFIALRDMSSLLPELSAAAGSRLMNSAGRLYVSQNAQAYEAIGRHANDKHASYFGIKGDGTDETTKWNNALAYFSDTGSGARPGRLILDPTGTSVISDTLQYRGDVSRPLSIYCPTPGNQGQTGFRLQWDSGAGTGKAVLRLLGANCCQVKNLCIDGAFLAKYLIHIDNRTGTAAFYPSSTNLIENCSLFAHGGDGCVAVAVGNDNADVANTQTSEVIVRACLFFVRQPNNDAGHGPAGHGFKALTSGNCKNFWLYDNAFAFSQVHADLGGSGNAIISGGGMSVATKACVIGGGNTVLEKLDYEGQNGFAAPLYGGQGGGGNPGYQLTIRNCEAVAPLQLAGGDYDQDDIMVRSFGKVLLEGNTFINQRTDTAESRVVVAGDYDPIPHNSGSGCTVHSRSNWYRASNLYAPIYDSSGNKLTGSNFYPTVTGHTVISENDTGGREGVDIHNLRNTRGQPIEFAKLRTRDEGDGYLTTPVAGGAVNLATHTKRVAYGALLNSSAPGWRSYLWTMNQYQRIRAARIRVDTPFTGVSGGLLVQLGIVPPGGASDLAGLLSVQQLVLAGDATAAAGTVYGAKEIEKGLGLHPSFLPGEGYYPDPPYLNSDGTYTVCLVLTSVTGANLTLTAGQLTVMLDTGSDEP
jgi:hypothetical protein